MSSVVVSAAQAQDAGALQRELQLQLQKSTPAPELERVKPAEPKIANPLDQKIFVKKFQFKGNTLVSDAQLQNLVKPWINTEITFGDLKDVTTAIQDYYAKQNRIASANVPPQEVKDGIVLIAVHEGKLGSVIVEPANPVASLRASPEIARLYFITKPDGTQFIDTKSLERAVLLLNDLPGITAAGVFEPGAKLEESDFHVKLTDGPVLSGQVALSNYGAASTGAGQVIAGLSLNDPSGFGDQSILDVIQSLGSTYGQLQQ